MGSTDYTARRPSQFRLPMWACEYVEARAAEAGVSKTDVVIEALECLRERESDALMEQGYREMSKLNAGLAEDAMAAEDGVPEW